jgi:hypothetical protein
MIRPIANFYTINEVRIIMRKELGISISGPIPQHLIHRIWNAWEDLNNEHYMYNVMIWYLNVKHHTYETDCTVIKKVRETVRVRDTVIQDIVSARNISHAEYNKLLARQRGGTASHEDCCVIEKYTYAGTFRVKSPDITVDWMKARYGKIPVLKNYLALVDGANNRLLTDDSYDDKIYGKQLNSILRIISIMGFNLLDLNQGVVKEQFQINKLTMLGLINDTFRVLFGLDKGYDKKNLDKYGDVESNKAFLGFVNGLLDEWGVRVNCKIKQVRIGKGRKKSNTYYNLHLIDIIDEYIKE